MLHMWSCEVQCRIKMQLVVTHPYAPSWIYGQGRMSGMGRRVEKDRGPAD